MATKKYILTKDQLVSSIEESEFPPTATAVKTETDKKVNIAQGSSAANKYIITDSDGNITTGDAPTQFHFEIFTSLPTAGSSYSQTIALIARTGTAEEKNVYVEYACVKTSETPETWAWEKLGDLTASISQDASNITVNGTSLNFASYTDASNKQCGIISGDTYNTFNSKQSAVPASTATGVEQVITNSANAGTFGTPLGFDTTPADSSNNLIKSKDLKTLFDGKVTKVEGTVSIGQDSTGYYFNEA